MTQMNNKYLFSLEVVAFRAIFGWDDFSDVEPWHRGNATNA
jgi:hypothetical protein